MKNRIFIILSVMFMLYAGKINASQYLSLQQNSGAKSVHGSEFENFTDYYQIDIDIKEAKNVRLEFLVDLGPNDEVGVYEVDQNGEWNEIYYTGGPLFDSETIVSSTNTGKMVFLINRLGPNNATGTGFDIKYGPDNSLVSNNGLFVSGNALFNNGCHVYGNVFSHNNTYTYGHNICYAYTGLGTGSPAARLHVVANTTLGNSAGNTAAITRLQGSTNTNNIYVNDYLLRETSGGDWTTASYIRGMSVDNSFLTPSTLRSWIKQNPYAEKIEFGSSGTTYMSVGSNVGIGTNATNYKLDVNGSAHFTNGILFGTAFAPDPNFINNDGNYISFSHQGVSEDFIGYKNNTFFLKDSPGGGDVVQPNLMVGGKVGININTRETPRAELEVNGTILASEVKVESVENFADYVFEKNYKLSDLKDVDKYIQDNGHLPEIPSATEVKEKGMNLVEMQVKLLQKVEELTLYTIQLQKEIERLKAAQNR